MKKTTRIIAISGLVIVLAAVPFIAKNAASAVQSAAITAETLNFQQRAEGHPLELTVKQYGEKDILYSDEYYYINPDGSVPEATIKLRSTLDTKHGETLGEARGFCVTQDSEGVGECWQQENTPFGEHGWTELQWKQVATVSPLTGRPAAPMAAYLAVKDITSPTNLETRYTVSPGEYVFTGRKSVDYNDPLFSETNSDENMGDDAYRITVTDDTYTITLNYDGDRDKVMKNGEPGTTQITWRILENETPRPIPTIPAEEQTNTEYKQNILNRAETFQKQTEGKAYTYTEEEYFNKTTGKLEEMPVRYIEKTYNADGTISSGTEITNNLPPSASRNLEIKCNPDGICYTNVAEPGTPPLWATDKDNIGPLIGETPGPPDSPTEQIEYYLNVLPTKNTTYETNGNTYTVTHPRWTTVITVTGEQITIEDQTPTGQPIIRTTYTLLPETIPAFVPAPNETATEKQAETYTQKYIERTQDDQNKAIFTERYSPIPE